MDQSIGESLWFAIMAFEMHYTRKYPTRKAMIAEMAEMLRKVLRAMPSDGGVVGMLQGWVEEFQENETGSDHLSCSRHRTRKENG